MVSFHSMTSDSRAHAGGGARGRKISTPPKCNYFWVKFFRSSYLDNHFSEDNMLVPKVAFTSFHGAPGSVPGVGSEVKI